jgi:hypothetical protein
LSTYPHLPQRKKKVAKKKESIITTQSLQAHFSIRKEWPQPFASLTVPSLIAGVGLKLIRSGNLLHLCCFTMRKSGGDLFYMGRKPPIALISGD